MNLKNDFLDSLNLNLTAAQLELLQKYADLVWDKKDSINLTSVGNKEEIMQRHIADGLIAAAEIKKLSSGNIVKAADYGAGAGYIGIAVKIALDFCEISLIESLEKRCMFMNWVIMKLGLKNINVINARARASSHTDIFDFTMERAMGKIDEVLPLCTAELKEGGYFIAYQGLDCGYSVVESEKSFMKEDYIHNYNLPFDDKTRKLIIFKKNGHN